MKTKDFEKISVTDICNGCGMNRKSFYYHFKDKYDLTNWIFYTEFISSISTGEYRSGWDLLRSVINLFYKDADFYRSAMKIEGQNSFRDYFYECMIPVFTMLTQGIDDSENKEELIRYMCDAYLAVFRRWLEDGCVQTPDEFVHSIKLLFQLMEENIGQDDQPEEK